MRIESTKLRGDLIVVPGVELKPARLNALRCFRATECDDGKLLAALVNRLLASPTLQLQDFRTYGETHSVRARLYEVWFAPGTITLTEAGAPTKAP